MYIPNKSLKFRIKIMMCDTKTKYAVDAMAYLGKGITPCGILQAQYFVRELTKGIHGSNRIITMDNQFMSVPLSTERLYPL